MQRNPDARCETCPNWRKSRRVFSFGGGSQAVCAHFDDSRLFSSEFVCSYHPKFFLVDKQGWEKAVDAVQRVKFLKANPYGATVEALIESAAKWERRALTAESRVKELEATMNESENYSKQRVGELEKERDGTEKRAKNLQEVHYEVYEALRAAGDRIQDIARNDLAHAVTALVKERNANKELAHTWFEKATKGQPEFAVLMQEVADYVGVDPLEWMKAIQTLLIFVKTLNSNLDESFRRCESLVAEVEGLKAALRLRGNESSPFSYPLPHSRGDMPKGNRMGGVIGGSAL